MYAATIVEQHLELATEIHGFKPTYHTTSEVDEFERRLEKRYEDAYAAARTASQGAEDPIKSFRIHISRALANPTKAKLTKEEVRFIKNERALIMCDAAYFLTRYYWILNRENYRQRFTFQDGQKILFEVISEMEALGIAIEIILAKARQLGMTTLVAGLELLKVMTSDGVGGVIASADRGKTVEMASKIFFAYDKLPWWLAPITSKRVESDNGTIHFAGIDSKIIFQHGKQTNPIAMGSTPVTYHLSEVSSFPDPENLIEVGLFKCVHPSPRVLGILESTCKGDSGWWHDTYWNSKNKWGSGESRLMALFLPFYCGTDMYPNDTWLIKSPIPRNWEPIHETRQMVAESEMYVQSNRLLEKILRANSGSTGTWEMPREKAWYWEANFKEHRSKGSASSWYQEMPHSDRVAFQGSYDNVFGREILAEVWTNRKTAYGVYGIVGQSIEDRQEPNPREIDYAEPIIPVTYFSRKSGEGYKWELLPLKWLEPFKTVEDIREEEDHMGKFFVWHPPEPGYDYSIGVDTSNGIGRDATCISVSRRGRTPTEEDVQVAEFRSNRVSHVEAYAWTLAISAYYARYMEDTTAYREPYVSIEQIAAVGDTCQLQMKKMGYSRFHHRKQYHTKNPGKVTGNNDGWYTSGFTRAILTDHFVLLVQNGWYKVNSPYTMREMTQWEVHFTSTGKDKYEHSSGETDDGIFANAMAAFCPNDTRLLAERSTKRFSPTMDGILPRLEMRVTSGIVVNPDYYGGMGMETPRELRAAMRRHGI